MAYFIFLKSLRSLEEFRKILMSKFLLNLLVQISKAFVYLKIQILFGNNFSSDSGPSDPAPSSPGQLRPTGRRARTRSTRPTGPEQPWRIYQKAPLLRVCAIRQRRFLSHVAAKWAPPVRSTPFLAPTDPNHISTAPRRN
jgi:hypothetical protein